MHDLRGRLFVHSFIQLKFVKMCQACKGELRQFLSSQNLQSLSGLSFLITKWVGKRQLVWPISSSSKISESVILYCKHYWITVSVLIIGVQCQREKNENPDIQNLDGNRGHKLVPFLHLRKMRLNEGCALPSIRVTEPGWRGQAAEPSLSCLPEEPPQGGWWTAGKSAGEAHHLSNEQNVSAWVEEGAVGITRLCPTTKIPVCPRFSLLPITDWAQCLEALSLIN